MSSLSQLKILVNLARVDGEIADEEKIYLRKIAQANKVPEAELEVLLNEDHEDIIPEKLSDEDRFNLVFKLVELMKADGKLYTEEIKYCAKIATKLGYREVVVFELMIKITSEDMFVASKDRLRDTTKEYLKKHD